MASDLGQVAQLLEATLDYTQHKKGKWAILHLLQHMYNYIVSSANSTIAEAALKLEEKKPQYSLQLLKIVATESDSVQPKIRLAAALAFKNFIRHNYVVCHN